MLREMLANVVGAIARILGAASGIASIAGDRLKITAHAAFVDN